MDKKLELYYYPACPFCQRVLRAMERLQLFGDIELKNIHRDPVADETLTRVGGKHQVPCLFIDGEPMYESRDIIAYLEKSCA